eukprot:2377238-Prymnesium_polylepis.1
MASATGSAAILGARSYVATFGDSLSSRTCSGERCAQRFALPTYRAHTSRRAAASGFRRGVPAWRRRTSPSKGSSLPPLKKKVTCANFSVSAAWNCVSPSFDT